MKNLIISVFVAFCSLSSTIVHAEDARIQTIEYSADAVVKIGVRTGVATLIQLEKGETLDAENTALGLGDAEAWNVGVSGNTVTIKPKASKPDTNMILVSSKRTYLFYLESVGKNDTPTFMVRFRYPDDKLATKTKTQSTSSGSSETSKDNKIAFNYKYSMKGATALAPTKAYDDGRFTYFEFNNARELPVIYKRMPDNTESLLNYSIDGYKVVVHELSNIFIFRLGKAALAVINDKYESKGRFNSTNTSTPGQVRVEQNTGAAQ